MLIPLCKALCPEMGHSWEPHFPSSAPHRQHLAATPFPFHASHCPVTPVPRLSHSAPPPQTHRHTHLFRQPRPHTAAKPSQAPLAAAGSAPSWHSTALTVNKDSSPLRASHRPVPCLLPQLHRPSRSACVPTAHAYPGPSASAMPSACVLFPACPRLCGSVQQACQASWPAFL